jgi:phosphatidylglycerol:prolipoprotein diacylglycerol transferase
MLPDGFYIGSFKIYFYSILIVIGVLAAVGLSIHEAKRRQENSDLIWDMVPWLLIGGIIGARLWHVLTPSASMGITASYYFEHPLEIFMTRKGGLGIPGAVIGGVIALVIYSRRKKINFLTWADIIVPGLALAQAIGRWGNFFNQELYGGPTNLPWAIFIDETHRLPQYANVAYYHPMFLYESIWNLFNMFLLLYLGRKFAEKMLPGDLLFTYLIVYPVGRFFLEFMRLDPSFVGGVNANQATMAVTAISSVIILLIRHRRKEVVKAEEEEKPKRIRKIKVDTIEKKE